MMTESLVLDAARTPFVRYDGVLAGFRTNNPE